MREALDQLIHWIQSAPTVEEILRRKQLVEAVLIMTVLIIVVVLQGLLPLLISR